MITICPTCWRRSRVGKTFGVEDRLIREAIEIPASNSRSQLVKLGSNQFVLDAYNANPSSMRLAIENFARMQASKNTDAWGHGGTRSREPGRTPRHRQPDPSTSLEQVVLVGGDFLKIDHPFRSFANSEEAREWWRNQHISEAQVLIKGSRSMQMEKILAN